MVALELFERLTKLQQFNYIGLEDSFDRLNFQVTVILLLAFCTTCTFKTYILSPVSCYLPNEVGAHSGQEQYVNNYCWTEGTYAVPVKEFKIDNFNPTWVNMYKDRRITYYQWVPFVLGLQALLFYMPRVIWSLVSYNRAGTDVDHLIRSANEAAQVEGDKHEKLVEHVSRRLEQTMGQLVTDCQDGERPQEMSQHFARRLVQNMTTLKKRFGIWLIVTYFIVKICYLANAIGQLFLMQKFLGFNTNFGFGAVVLKNLLRGKDWKQTMIFPRVGCCAVYFRGTSLGNYIFSQCTLPINMINEKIYIFLWFWILFTAITTFISLPVWMYRILWVQRRAKFVKGYLRLCDNHEEIDRRDCNRFVRKFLRHDGVFLLKMIALNSGDVVCTDIIRCLWKTFMEKQYGKVQTKDYYKKNEQSTAMPNSETAFEAEDTTLVKRSNSNPNDSAQEKKLELKQQLSEPGPD